MSLLFGDPNDPSPIGVLGCTIIYDSVRDEKPIFLPARDPFALSSDWEYPELLDEWRALCNQSRLFGGPGIRGFQYSYGCFAGARPAFTETKLPQIIRAPNFGDWHAELLDSLNDRILIGGGVQVDAGWRGIIKPYHSILLELMRDLDSGSVSMNKARSGALQDFLMLVRETTDGSLLFGVGVNSDAGLTGSVVINERSFDVANSKVNSPDVGTEAIPETRTPRSSIYFPTSTIEDKPLYFRFDFGYYRIR
jgi:hypothetical protein